MVGFRFRVFGFRVYSYSPHTPAQLCNVEVRVLSDSASASSGSASTTSALVSFEN